MVGTVAKDIPANHNSNLGLDKSIVDDFVASSYCKCESIPVIRSTEVFAVFLRFVLPYFKFDVWKVLESFFSSAFVSVAVDSSADHDRFQECGTCM